MSLSRRLPVMQFSLIYDGPLSASGNKPKRKEKWAIRKAIDPQLRRLWSINPDLQELARNCKIPSDGAYSKYVPHHSAASTLTSLIPTMPRVHASEGEGAVSVGDVFQVPGAFVDLCAPIVRGAASFLPLVRESLALTCGLQIKFMRQEPKGRIFQGGDIDGRIKTFLDALSAPQNDNEICSEEGDPSPMYCLLENDALVIRLDVATERLLTSPTEAENWVRLYVSVDVRVSRARPYNEIFLGD